MTKWKNAALLAGLLFVTSGCGELTAGQRNALNGAAAGALLGAGAGAIAAAAQSGTSSRYAYGLGLGSAVGAVIGAIIGYYYLPEHSEAPPLPPPGEDRK